MEDHGDLTRYAFFPIQYPELEEFYQIHKRMVWTAQEVDYSNDRSDWDRLDDNTKKYIKFLLFLFAQLDGIVNENLVENFISETSFCKECSMFYSVQAFMEWGHNETYSQLIKAFIRDPEEQIRGLNSISNFPQIRKIADWSFEWMQKERPLLERVIAFACTEGITFSSAFAGIYWIKRRNILHGLTKANEWIARDEALHTQFAIALYHTMTRTMEKYKRLPQERVHAIVKSAVDTTEVFTREAMNVDLVGISADDMVNYVRCTADVLLESLGYEKLYNVTNPFDWMAIIALGNKTNFFESKVSEYARQGTADFTFDLDAPF